VARLTVTCILKPLFFVENSVLKSPPNSNNNLKIDSVKSVSSQEAKDIINFCPQKK